MHLVYFSHSYRTEDSEIVGHFGRLISASGLTPVLDAPSDGVNGARLQRHIRDSDGMIAVLTRREGGVSPNILFEIALCLQARKPLLVFIEDVVSAELVPYRVLRSRFSRKWYFRQLRDHQHTLALFKTYLGAEPPPRYQPVATGLTCLTIGLESLKGAMRDGLRQEIAKAGYQIVTQQPKEHALKASVALSETLACVDVVVEIISSDQPADRYLSGAVRAAFLPRISLAAEPRPPVSDIPDDYRPRTISTGGSQTQAARKILAAQFELYERAYVAIETPDEVTRYVDALVRAGNSSGFYDHKFNATIIEAMHVGDSYKVGQAGAVGKNARSDGNSFQQIWSENGSEIDLAALAEGLAKLRAAARAEANTAEQEAALGQLASAEIAARQKNGPAVIEHLKGAGKWSLSVAEKIGIDVATAAIKTALGV